MIVALLQYKRPSDCCNDACLRNTVAYFLLVYSSLLHCIYTGTMLINFLPYTYTCFSSFSFLLLLIVLRLLFCKTQNICEAHVSDSGTKTVDKFELVEWIYVILGICG